MTSNLIILSTGSAQLNEASPSVSMESSPSSTQSSQTETSPTIPMRSFQKDPTSSFYEDELIVRFRSSVEDSLKQQILAENKAVILHTGQHNRFLVKVAPTEREQILSTLQADPNVEYAVYNQVGHANESSGVGYGSVAQMTCYPNDFYYCYGYYGDHQWGLYGIYAPQAWIYKQSSSSIKIAVLDSGVDYNSYDLNNNKVIKGRDFIGQDNNPMDENPGSHGTAIAGIAAANTSNSYGMAGVNWYAKIVAIRTAPGYTGEADPYFFAEGIYEAVDVHRAHVINISYSFSEDNPDLRHAVDYATTDGEAIIVASTNQTISYPINPSSCFMEFPAAYFRVISVAAIDDSSQLYSGCTGNVKNGVNYQPIQVAAPGKNIISLVKNTPASVAFYSGTSFAAPHVAGVAAFLRSCTSRTNTVYDIILGAYDLGSLGWDSKFGFGRLDMYSSLLRARNRDECL